MGEEKRDRGFKTIYCGSQVPQYSAFFGFDFAGGGLGYFDMKVIEVHDLIQGIGKGTGCFPDFSFGQGIKRFSRPWTNRTVRASGYRRGADFLMHRQIISKETTMSKKTEYEDLEALAQGDGGWPSAPLREAARGTWAAHFRRWTFWWRSTFGDERQIGGARWPERDRFILSKGHSSIGQYVVMALRGISPSKSSRPSTRAHLGCRAIRT